jgi:hypothetical protein
MGQAEADHTDFLATWGKCSNAKGLEEKFPTLIDKHLSLGLYSGTGICESNWAEQLRNGTATEDN